MAKPIVDRLERQLKGKALVIRINIQEEVGHQLRARHSVKLVPTFILFDGLGEEVWRQSGRLPDQKRMLEEIRSSY